MALNVTRDHKITRRAPESTARSHADANGAIWTGQTPSFDRCYCSNTHHKVGRPPFQPPLGVRGEDTYQAPGAASGLPAIEGGRGCQWEELGAPHGELASAWCQGPIAPLRDGRGTLGNGVVVRCCGIVSEVTGISRERLAALFAPCKLFSVS